MTRGLIALAVLAGLLVTAAAAQADREFTPRFSANDTGDITFAANTLMTCPASDSRCAPAQSGGNYSNNSFAMGYVDVDGDPTTFDSSNATLNLPTGAEVLFAGL